MKKSIVLAYSGGLRSSVAIPWLLERGDAVVVTVTLDLGQTADLVEVRERAMTSGATRSHVLDTREEFVRDFVLPTLKADALSDGRYPMATALGRPMIAKKLAEIARLENATIVAHGCSGRDRVRLARPLRALDPSLTELAFVDEWGLTDATIAAFYAHRADASDGADIARQLVEGGKVDIAMGGGSGSGDGEKRPVQPAACTGVDRVCHLVWALAVSKGPGF